MKADQAWDAVLKGRMQMAASTLAASLVRDADARREFAKAGALQRLTDLMKSDDPHTKHCAGVSVAMYAQSDPELMAETKNCKELMMELWKLANVSISTLKANPPPPNMHSFHDHKPCGLMRNSVWPYMARRPPTLLCWPEAPRCTHGSVASLTSLVLVMRSASIGMSYGGLGVFGFSRAQVLALWGIVRGVTMKGEDFYKKYMDDDYMMKLLQIAVLVRPVEGCTTAPESMAGILATLTHELPLADNLMVMKVNAEIHARERLEAAGRALRKADNSLQVR